MNCKVLGRGQYLNNNFKVRCSEIDPVTHPYLGRKTADASRTIEKLTNIRLDLIFKFKIQNLKIQNSKFKHKNKNISS